MRNFSLLPQDDPQQALRVKRMLMGVGSYTLYALQTLLCGYLGIFTWTVVIVYFLIIISLNFVLYLALRTGFSKRFADPSLTFVQLMAAIPTGLYLMYFGQEFRLLFVLMGVPVFLFGVFKFELRQFLWVAFTAVAGYMGLVWLLVQQGKPVDFSLEALTVVALIAMMVQISMLGAYISRLRNKIKDKNQQLAGSNAELLARSEQLSRAHREMEQTLQTLRVAHEELVRKEKLAALGSLVAGIAHEINTPIGNSLLAASMLNDETRSFHLQIGELNQQARSLQNVKLADFIGDASSACDILLINLRRAADLITSFKQVAIDQTSSQRRIFPVVEVVQEILMMLSPMLKHTNYSVVQEVPAHLCMDSYPGPLGQVLTNLVNNAILHGFDGCESGNIEIGARELDEERIQIWVVDDGVGISAANLNRIFDPFFTTKLGTGGSGLGLNITHNIITGILGGKIDVSSEEGRGTRFVLTLPKVAPQHATQK